MTTRRGEVESFFRDLAPFFQDQKLVYVEFGTEAEVGRSIEELLESDLSLGEALIIEPDPAKRGVLLGRLAARNSAAPLALTEAGDAVIRVRPASCESLDVDESTEGASELLEPSRRGASSAQGESSTPEHAPESEAGRAGSFDELTQAVPDGRISLLRIGVEGLESGVLDSAQRLLQELRVDVLYLEACMAPTDGRRSHFRAIDDFLTAYGYRVFRIYKQRNSSPDDVPFLRHAHVAYFSPEFARSHPQRLSLDLFTARNKHRTRLQELEAVNNALEQVKARLESEDARRSATLTRVAQLESDHASVSKEHADLRNGLVATRREVKEKERRLRDFGERYQRARLDADEMKARVERILTVNRECLAALESQRTEAEELERARGAATERVQVLQGRLQAQRDRLSAVEGQLRELTGRRDTLAEHLRQQETQHLAEVARLRRQRARSATASKLELKEVVKATTGARRTEAKRLTRMALKLERAASEAESTLSEAVTMLAEVARSERQSRMEAAAAQHRLEQVEGHLSYRVGTAIVKGSKSPAAWLRMPATLRRSYREFQRDRKHLTATRNNAFDGHVLAKRSAGLLVPLDSDWCAVRVLNKRPSGSSTEPLELWARVMTSRPRHKVQLEFALPPDSRGIQVIPSSGELEKREAAAPGTGETWDLCVRGREPLRLLSYPAGAGHVQFRIRSLGGDPAILRLEVRSANEGKRPPAANPTIATSQPWTVTRPSAGTDDWDALDEPGPVWQADQLSRHGQVKEGVALLLARGLPLERMSAALLLANHAKDDTHWLAYVNEYMGTLGIAPLALKAGDQSRFARLCAAPVPRISEGPLVTVIMPVYNGAATLRMAAKSILAQSWRPLELIIVDDASTDSTPEIGRELARRDMRVKFMRNEGNVGPYVSRNVGVRASCGQFLTCHDADDWAHPQRIELHVQAMLRERLKASMTRMLRMNAEGEFSPALPRQNNVDDGFLRLSMVSCMFDAKFFKERLGHWDSVRFAADSELIWRANHLLGGQLPLLRQLGMLCLDSTGSLTRSTKHGAGSQTRLRYSTSFKLWHTSLDPDDPDAASVPFNHQPRRFEAPQVMLANPDVVARIERGKTVDVCIVTNLTYPGGNASSTLDEVRQCLNAGLTVQVLHCARRKGGKRVVGPFAGRFSDVGHLCEEPLANAKSYQCEVLIIRNPTVITAEDLPRALADVRAKTVVFVVNNSLLRPTGEPICTEDELLHSIQRLPFPDKRVFPLGPAIRHELLHSSLADKLPIAPFDWSPTFDVAQFPRKPPTRIGTRIRIGRHGRDGREKWLKRPEDLRAVYPDSPTTAVRILGGADNAQGILGSIPPNWEVLPFGSVHPSEFLAGLDVFVYFPDEKLNEAFGRTVIEAILVGLPCVLPLRMERTFRDLAIYCEPQGVPAALERLRDSFEECTEFVETARECAVARYATESFLGRLASVSPDLAKRLPAATHAMEESERPLPEHLRSYARWVATGAR